MDTWDLFGYFIGISIYLAFIHYRLEKIQKNTELTDAEKYRRERADF